MNKSKFLPLSAMLIPTLLFAYNSQGADYAKKEALYIEYKQPAQVTISSTGINRISLYPFIATTIWGDAAEYSALLSHNGSELFLTSKVQPGKSFALAVQLAEGRVIDLLLHTIEANRPKIVHLELPNENSSKAEDGREIKQLIEAMRSKAKSKYYVLQMKKPIKINSGANETFASLAAEQTMVYRYGDFVGIVLKLKNNSKKEVPIDAKCLSEAFKGVLAVSLHDQLLKRGGNMEAFLVLKRELEV